MMKIKWPQIIDKYIGKPYELGGWGNPGYDCFSLLISVLKDSGLYIPLNSEWKGIKLSDYNYVWEEDKNKARQIVCDAMSQFLIEDKGQIQQGNVVLLTGIGDTTNTQFFSLYISNRFITSIKQSGVRAFPAKYFKICNKYKVNYEYT